MADQPNEPTEQPGQPEPGKPPPGRRFHRRYRPREKQPNREGEPPVVSPEEGGKPAAVPDKGRHHVPEMDITVIIPLYNEEESLRELYRQLRESLSRLGKRYEMIFVDDGSTDNSYNVLRDLKRTDYKHIKIVRFRRNYGKSAAISVGFDKAVGRSVITLDADLQDDPAEIPNLLKKLNEGYDLVSGWKKVRRDPLSKTIPSRFFNYATGVMTGIQIHDFNCGLKAYKKEVVKTVNVYGELHRYVPVLAHWEGFKISEIPVQHRQRKYGKTKFGITRFWRGFLDLLTVLFTTRYFRKPLHLFGFWGLLSALAGVAIVGYLVVQWMRGEISLSNRPLLLGGIMMIIVGIQFVSIGLLAELISKGGQGEMQYQIRDYIP